MCETAEMPWVIFKLLNQEFALSAIYVKEIVVMPSYVPLPETPDYIRGSINLRGDILSVVDLRKRVGMNSLTDEIDDLIKLLNQREEDHINWIVELESSVNQQREFKLATDPHKCAFGKWYDNFKTDNRTLKNCLAKFDAPHQKIHSIAKDVKTKEEQKDFDAALEIINKTKENELKEMRKLFAEARLLLVDSNREIALVIEWDDDKFVLAVDSISTVENILESNIEKTPKTSLNNKSKNKFISGIAKRNKTENLVQLFDINSILVE